jgi:dihydrofolate synthase / folylpolyglutamate synthase
MLNSYQETLTYLYANLPMFQRVGVAAFKKDLTNTLRLCEVLGNPHTRFKSIHIAGTNGKGSTSHMLASILQSCGYKTGLYTSPHLKEFTERIRVNGIEVEQQFVVDFVNRIRPEIERIQPSFFEITVAMAFAYFAEKQVDIAVIEVGLGGRLDSTNVITPVLSVITNIGWDHTDLLGDTLEKIAAEKAGIIKPDVPVVVSERQQGIDSVFKQKASETHSMLYFASDVFTIEQKTAGGTSLFDVLRSGKVVYAGIALPLQGLYQQKNLAGVMMTVDVLRHNGWLLTEEGVRYGLEKVVEQTTLKGRWQVLRKNPQLVCDTAHNVDGIRYVMEQIKSQSFKTLHVVWGMVKDKDRGKILSLLPVDAQYYFCQANIPRALDAYELAAQAVAYGLRGDVIPDVNNAVRTALARATSEDFIFIGGSTFVVAEIEGL